MSLTNSRWPPRALGAAFAILGVLHLLARLFSVFVYHADTQPAISRYFFPVYGRLGPAGVWLFALTIVVDFVAAIELVGSFRRQRTWALAAGVANLPVIPLGTAVGVAALLMLRFVRSRR